MSPRKVPDRSHATRERSDTSSARSRDAARQGRAPAHRGRVELHATLGSEPTASRGATHPGRATPGGALRDGVVRPRGSEDDVFSEDFAEGDTEPGRPGALDAVAQPSRDDVHEQRTDPQPREAVVSGALSRRARPRSPA